MLYLLYIKDGFIKKFPLNQKTLFIGRHPKNDFTIQDTHVSQQHARIDVYPDHIVVEDLGSTNGITVETFRIHKARISINQCFRLGYLNFFLKESAADELELSTKIKPVIGRTGSGRSTDRGDKTQQMIQLLYSESMMDMLKIGLNLEELVDIFKFGQEVFETTLKKGCLVLITREGGQQVIESKWNYDQSYYSIIFDILQHPDAFQKTRINQRTGQGFHYSSFPFSSLNKTFILIYLIRENHHISGEKISFLKDLSLEISILDSLIEQHKAIARKDRPGVPTIITQNQQFLNLLNKCRKIATTGLFVIIEGETGTGKELVARFIHAHSKKRDGNFVGLNCAAIPEDLMESELFGHEKGAFTDAGERKNGKLELSSGGTLVLDEIGDMPLSLQKKLLRAIQEGQFYRVGGNKPIEVDLRIICLTHRDIPALIRKREFRDDLYYRLNHVNLRIPPLRDRRDDIIPLINHFTRIFSRQSNIIVRGFSDAAIRAMEHYPWPGNVRELENEIKKCVSLSDDNEVIDLSMLKARITEPEKTGDAGNDQATAPQKEQLLRLLEIHKWNKTQVAQVLEISRTALYDKLRKFGIR